MTDRPMLADRTDDDIVEDMTATLYRLLEEREGWQDAAWRAAHPEDMGW